MRPMLVVLLASTALFAQKSVFIQNDSGYAVVADTAAPEIKKHFKLADSKASADLVFVFTRISHSAHTSGSVDENGDVSARTYEEAILELDVIDARSGDKLWTNSRPWGSNRFEPNVVSMFHKTKPPARQLIDDYLKSH